MTGTPKFPAAYATICYGRQRVANELSNRGGLRHRVPTLFHIGRRRAHPYTPKWTYNFTASYDIKLSSGVLSSSVTYSHVDQQWNGVFQNTSNCRRLLSYLGTE